MKIFTLSFLLSIIVNLIFLYLLLYLGKEREYVLVKTYPIEIVSIKEKKKAVAKPKQLPKPKKIDVPKPEMSESILPEPAPIPVKSPPVIDEVEQAEEIVEATETERLEPLVHTPKELDTPLKIIRMERPKYPEIAKKAGVETRILLKLLITPEGKVEGVEIIRSDVEGMGFEEEAERAVKRWLFSKPTVNGVGVYVWYILPLKFSLK